MSVKLDITRHAHMITIIVFGRAIWYKDARHWGSYENMGISPSLFLCMDLSLSSSHHSLYISVYIFL